MPKTSTVKNQRGFSGFCSGKAIPTGMAAGLLPLTRKLRTLFAGVVQEQGAHTWPVTSRDDLLHLPAKLAASGRQGTLKLAVSEKCQAAISQDCKRLHRWQARSAPQLDGQQTFELYLCWHNPLSPQNWPAASSP